MCRPSLFNQFVADVVTRLERLRCRVRAGVVIIFVVYQETLYGKNLMGKTEKEAIIIICVGFVCRESWSERALFT